MALLKPLWLSCNSISAATKELLPLDPFVLLFCLFPFSLLFAKFSPSPPPPFPLFSKVFSFFPSFPLFPQFSTVSPVFPFFPVSFPFVSCCVAFCPCFVLSYFPAWAREFPPCAECGWTHVPYATLQCGIHRPLPQIRFLVGGRVVAGHIGKRRPLVKSFGGRRIFKYKRGTPFRPPRWLGGVVLCPSDGC